MPKNDVTSFTSIHSHCPRFTLGNRKPYILGVGEYSQVTEGTQTTPRVSVAGTFPLFLTEPFQFSSGVQVSEQSVLLERESELIQFENSDKVRRRSDVKNLQRQTIYDSEKKELSKYPKDGEKFSIIGENFQNFSLKTSSYDNQNNKKKNTNSSYQNKECFDTLKNSPSSEKGKHFFEEEFSLNRNGLTQFNEHSNALISDKTFRQDNSTMMMSERFGNDVNERDQKGMNNDFHILSRKTDTVNVIDKAKSEEHSSLTKAKQNCHDNYNKSSKIGEFEPNFSSINDKTEFDKPKDDSVNVDVDDSKICTKNSQDSLSFSPKSSTQHSSYKTESLNVNNTEHNESLSLPEMKIKGEEKISESLGKFNEENRERKTSDTKSIESDVKPKNNTIKTDQLQHENKEENIIIRNENSSENDKNNAYREMLRKISEKNSDKEFGECESGKALPLPKISTAYDAESIDSVEAAILEATATRSKALLKSISNAILKRISGKVFGRA
ncbi:hypothetical protein Avbf_11833 [Armadillidium vulgare]|nr:hypothetical protein Avbf_11833 [Armadillidium vulgare]